LNILEVITADRVVAQASTDHAYPTDHDNGHVPEVNFLGTQFDNLRVAGVSVPVKLNIDIFGKKPGSGRPYGLDPEFLQHAKNQAKLVADAPDLPKTAKDTYSGRLTAIDNLITGLNEGGKGDGKPVVVTCSLVESIGPIPVPGVKVVGNVLYIPHFGWVSLAEVEVSSSKDHGNLFTLRMLNLTMGCIGDGNLIVTTAKTNGNEPPGNH
jgi:hypothetical protein